MARFLQDSCTFGCDKQGRAMLSESILKRAGIGKDVYMVGMGTSFELWDPKRRESWMNEYDPSVDDISIAEELGL